MAISELQLPGSGPQAAQLCLAARLPSSDPSQIRAAASRAAAYGAELTQCAQAVLTASQSAGWTGAAAEAFTDRMRGAAPNLDATAQRYHSYAGALLGYAQSVMDLTQPLQSARSELAAQFARPVATPIGASLSGPLAVLDPNAQAAQQVQQHDDELMRLAKRFSWLYNQWVDSVRACVAGLRAADSHDPTHDLHGWSLWGHRLASYVEPVTEFFNNPSWANASNALSWLGSNLTFIALGMLLLASGPALVVLFAAAMVSAVQLGVDSVRKFAKHQDVSDADLGLDLLGAAPVPGLAKGAEMVSAAGRRGAGAEIGLAKVRGFSAGAAPEFTRLAKTGIKSPVEAYAPGYRTAAADEFRSGTPAELAKKWAAPLTWDAPNAVLGLPQILGGTSVPQLAYAGAKSEINGLSSRGATPGKAGTSDAQPGDARTSSAEPGLSSRHPGT